MKYWYANSHLAALARTCRTFKEPALNMIWADLDDLTPLIRCLPETLWAKSEGVYSLRKHLGRNEWDIILGYTIRVRTLPCLYGSFGLAEDCTRALSNPPTSMESIFPNLRVLGLHMPNATIAPLLRHLIHPELTNIVFERLGGLCTAAEVLGERCRLVTDFRVWEWAQADTISGLVCGWQNLRSVDCHDVGLNVDALSHLSRLRNLRSVSFQVHNAVVDRICATESLTLTFPTLDSIYLSSDSLTPIRRLLCNLRTPVIRDLSVGLQVRPIESDLMSFTVALRDACAHDSLIDLSLRVFDPPSDQPHHTPPYYISFDRLHPFTVFVNIKSVRLDIRCGTSLNEREFLSLASSWPYLECFEVGENYDWTASSAITPGGFLQLLERCRSLRVLYFMFDTHGYKEILQGHPWRGLTAPRNMFIHVLHSPIEEESIDALDVFFHVAPYPNFTLTTHWNNYYFKGREQPRELCHLYYNRWVRARSLALDLWREKGDLRRSLEHQSSSANHPAYGD